MARKNPLVSPILKWVGGKRQLLDSIEPLIPKCSTYYEPFIGGGAVLFSRQPDKAVINDSNPELINVYLTIKDEPKALIEKLKEHKEYGITDEFLEYVAKAAPMHDLGKIAVDDRVLRKPGSFTPEEFEEMKKHAEKGAEIVMQILDGVNDVKFVEIARNIAHYHHEKWNGQGYPEKLSGIDIPLEARIMALADVFDALVSKRCYKEKMDYDRAFIIIEESLGSHFDPELGKMFIKCREQLEKYYDEMEN